VNRDSTAGLNPSSADLVDVLHTDGKSLTGYHLGMMNVLGHVDFYPNGAGRQPSCILRKRSIVEPTSTVGNDTDIDRHGEDIIIRTVGLPIILVASYFVFRASINDASKVIGNIYVGLVSSVG